MTRGRRGKRARRRPLAGLTVGLAIFGLVAGAAALTWTSGAIQAPVTTSAASLQPRVTGNPFVDSLLGRMSLADKLRLLEWAGRPGQAQAVLPGLPGLGIPSLHLAEGAPGNAARPSVAMTAPLGVAATFSQADAYANGAVLGRDARALGQQAVAGPFGALDTGGAAAAATFGADPLLAGRTAAAEIAGLQAQGTMAVADGGPTGPGVTPGAAALHEIYLQPVQDAVRAGAAGILCPPAGTRAGPPPCGNAGLLLQVLRRELGFQGFVLAAPGANPGTLSLDSGLDGEIPGAARYFSPAAVRAALASGTISVATVNQAVGTVLAEMNRFGLLGPAPARPAPPAPAAADERAVARTAQDAATLLKNTGHALPLGPAAMSSLALIGPGAAQVAGGGPGEGNGTGTGSAQPGALQALRQDMATHPGARLSYAVGDDMTGTPVPATALSHLGQPGLMRSGTGQVTPRVVSAVDNTVAGGSALPARSRYTWTGELTVPVAGTYGISLGTGGAWGALTVDGTVVAQDRPGPGPARPAPAAAAPAAPAPATASAQAAAPARTAGPAPTTTPAQVTAPAQSAAPAPAATPTPAPAATSAQVTTPALAATPAPAAIRTAGTTPAPGRPGGALLPTTDGLDNLRASIPLTAGTHTLKVRVTPDGSGRPVQARLDWVTPARQQADLAAAVSAARAARAAVVFAWSAAGDGPALPDGQDQLIAAVAAANPDTIVVLNTPGPVAMPWLGSVRAVLEMWYPGEAGGPATANVLLGRAGPAGRLPVTWPAAAAQAGRGQPAGGLAGYRRYGAGRPAPLFPFGYGLSYTRFRFSGLRWHAAPGGGLALSFRVANTGHRAGVAVPQAYLGAPAARPPGTAFADRALAAYTRVSLRPGESRQVTMVIPERQLQYWDDTRGWVTAPGRRALYLGGDERASALTATVTIRG